MVKIFILSVVLILIALLGLSFKLIFDKKAEFKAGSCGRGSQGLKDKDIPCGCGGICSTEN